MAVQLLSITRTFQQLRISPNCRPALTLAKTSKNDLYPRNALTWNSTRNFADFFNKLPSSHLWKAITSVSNAGKKRGRGKRVSKANIKDLNRGQIIGVGKANIVWPGLSAPIIRGKELVQQQQLPEDVEREKKLIELRDQMGKFKHQKLSPIDRGWTGAKLPGRSIGPPDPVGEDTFEGFDTKVLEIKTVFCMKGDFGRRRRMSAFVVVGNGNGLAGFGLGGALEGRGALRKAKNRAAQKLMDIKMYKNHTVCHDFFTSFGKTKIFVSQKPEGYGLVCHRALKTICEVIGIKNMYARVEGSTNINHLTKAFFLGLIRQRTAEQLAEEKQLHLVEICKENNYFPTVIASPKECRKVEEIPKDEILDFKQFCLDGNIIQQREKRPPFYASYYSYYIYLKKYEKIRNQPKVKKQLLTEYGEIRSFLTDQYPECKSIPAGKKKTEESEEESVTDET